MRVRFKAGKVEDLSKYSKYVYLLSSDRNYLPFPTPRINPVFLSSSRSSV